MKHPGPSFPVAVKLLIKAAYLKTSKQKDLAMSGDPHYRPKALQAYLGYDQRVSWQILVAWFWMVALAQAKIMPAACAKLLTKKLLQTMLVKITTTKVTRVERTQTKHDILALLKLMRKEMPRELYPYLHIALTSYDVISTAYAVQLQQTFSNVFYPQACVVDHLWRIQIQRYANTLFMERTHLQDALPGTVGYSLSVPHSRFVGSVMQARIWANQVNGKFSGAIGTGAALKELFPEQYLKLERVALDLLGLPPAKISTQIVQPENMERFYHELQLTSKALAQLGENVRHLQASSIGEVTSASSTSSTMPHKGANPVAAEQIAGMSNSVLGEFIKIALSANSDLGRDLRNSNVMRGYNAVMVFAYQQLLTAERLLQSFRVDEDRCIQNFWVNGKLVTAELLHLSLQLAGYPGAHALVNKVIVPRASKSGQTLAATMIVHLSDSRNTKLKAAWSKVPERVIRTLDNSDEYIGRAAEMARAECKNKLESYRLNQ